MPFNAIVEVSKQVPWHHVTCAYGSRLSTSLGHHPTRDQSLDGWAPIAAIVHQQLHGKARCHGLGRTNRRRYLRPPLRTTRNRGESMAICGRSSSFQTRMINLWKVIWIYLNLVRNRGESMAICGRSSSFQTRMINLWKVIWIYLNLVKHAPYYLTMCFQWTVKDLHPHIPDFCHERG